MLCVSVTLTKACMFYSWIGLLMTNIFQPKLFTLVYPSLWECFSEELLTSFLSTVFSFTWISSTPLLVRHQKLDAVLESKPSTESSLVSFAKWSGHIISNHWQLLRAREPFHICLQAKYFLRLKQNPVGSSLTGNIQYIERAASVENLDLHSTHTF